MFPQDADDAADAGAERVKIAVSGHDFQQGLVFVQGRRAGRQSEIHVAEAVGIGGQDLRFTCAPRASKAATMAGAKRPEAKKIGVRP